MSLTNERPVRAGGASASSAFWKYWASRVASRTGDGITAAAMPLVAIDLLGASNFQVALLTAASYAALVFIGLPAGVVVRRLALKRVQVAMDAFRGLMIMSVPLAAWFKALTLAQLVVVAFAVGLAGNLFDVANSTFLPQVVPKAELTQRNSLLSATGATTQLVGPSLGGLLVQAFGAVWSVVGDAISYVISAAILFTIPSTPRTAAPVGGGSFLRELSAGIAYVFRHRVMRPAMFAATAVNFAGGALLACTAPFLVRQLAEPQGTVGLVLAAEGVGSIIAAAAVVRMVTRIGNARTLLLAAAVCPIAAVLMPAANGVFAVPIFAFGVAGLAAGVTGISVIARTHRQVASPPEFLSRVMASVRFVSQGVIPFGALLGGAISSWFTPRAGLIVVVLASACAPVALWLSPIRSLRALQAPATD